MSANDISPRQARFCQYYTEGLSATAAYKKAYDKDGRMSDSTAAASGSKLLRNHKIIGFIKQIRDEAARVNVKSVTEVQSVLSSMIDDASVKAAVRTKAAETLLKSLGAFDSESIQINNSVYGYGDEETIIILPPQEAEENCLWHESDKYEEKETD